MILQNKLRIVYAGIRNENYDARRANSFEYQNFYLTLKNMPNVEVIECPYDQIIHVGREKFNNELLMLVKTKKPDLFFAFMYTDELSPRVLLEIKKITKSIAWFADDYWRFFNYSKHWPPYFTYVVTTYSRAVDWYRVAGHENVILSQWACNTSFYKPVEIKKDIDVSFVGQHKSGRTKVIDALRRAGINVQCFGFGWPNGKVSHEGMLKIFGRSKICLNLTDRKSLWDPSVIGRLFLRISVNRIVPDFHFVDNLKAYLHFPTIHTHARPFELAGCQAFVISGWSEDIGKYYKEDKEIVCYRSTAELIEKIKRFLPHDAEREAIAKAAYNHTIKDHTYEKRFQKIFSKIGLS
ncbi:MAG: glycosyltransferase [Candidatus Liptonbacteria bacterium]|nr:glycosyltransferase [Candidatus Liptonbacteria bacterium]